MRETTDVVPRKQVQKNIFPGLNSIWLKAHGVTHGMNQLPGVEQRQFESMQTFLLERNGHKGDALAILQCFLAIASPGSLLDLSKALNAARHLKQRPFEMKFDSVAQAYKTLDSFEDIGTIEHLVKRFALISICQRHEDISRQMQFEYIGVKQSEVLDALTWESFENEMEVEKDEAFVKRKKKLKNRRQWGKRWLKLQRSFSPGVIALFCTTKRNGGVANHMYDSCTRQFFYADLISFERLTEEDLNILIEMLVKYQEPFLTEICQLVSPYVEGILRGDDMITRFRFERVEEEHLLGMSFHSPDLLKSCHLVDL